MTKSNKILLLSSFILIGFVFSIFFHYILNVYFKMPANIFGNFVWPVREKFSDFSGNFWVITTALKNPYIFSYGYSPLIYIFFIPLIFFLKYSRAYLVLLSIFSLFMLYFNIKFLNCKNLSLLQNIQNILIFSFCSYPFLFIIDSGNSNILTFIFLGLFTLFYSKEKHTQSCTTLAILICFNHLFAFFIFLYLFKKDWKHAITTTIFTFIFFFLNMLLFNLNPITYFGLINKYISTFMYTYISHLPSLTNLSSLFALFNAIITRHFPLVNALFVYGGFASILGLYLIVLTKQKKEPWKQVTLLLFFINLLPFYVQDYKLLLFFAPIYLFANEEKTAKTDLIYTILFGILLLPKPFGMFINPLIMLIFLLILGTENKIEKLLTNKKELTNE